MKMKDMKEVELLDTTSLIVKIVDSQREAHFMKEIEQETPSVKYMSKELQKQYTYKILEGGFFS